MDEIVKQALRKWPNVPACSGWLGLDQRGRWWLRDEAAQQAGDFLHSKGTVVEHDKLLAFIARNYAVDAQGRWFFQNGPQRVFVELELAPMVWRVQADGAVHSHTEVAVRQVQQVVVDEYGYVFLLCDGVLGVVHAQDVLAVSELIERGQWSVSEVVRDALELRFGFVRSPQAMELKGSAQHGNHSEKSL